MSGTEGEGRAGGGVFAAPSGARAADRSEGAASTATARATGARGTSGELAGWLEELFAAGAGAGPAGDRARGALLEPVLEFLARPGKRIRARLCEYAYELAGGRGAAPPRIGLAMELLHAGSLIVDDIEDGAAHRRGGPALHRARGLPTALNAGNWLYFAALEILAGAGVYEDGAPADRAAVQTLLRCHEGQALDVSVRVCDLPRGEIYGVVEAISSRKTAALTELAARLAAAAAGAGEGRRRELARFGHELGVYLQMLDDLSGVARSDRRDKGAEDLTLSRATWPWAWVAESARPEELARMQARARRVADEGAPAEPELNALAEATGELGAAAARTRISQALGVLEEGIAPGPRARELVAELEGEVRGMEGAFGA